TPERMRRTRRGQGRLPSSPRPERRDFHSQKPSSAAPTSRSPSGAPTLRAMRLAARPGSSGSEAAPMKAKVAQAPTDSTNPRASLTHRGTAGRSCAPGAAGGGDGRAAGIATGKAGTGTAAPRPGHGTARPAASSGAAVVLPHFGQLMGIGTKSPESDR